MIPESESPPSPADADTGRTSTAANKKTGIMIETREAVRESLFMNII
jgi:hypothetical protein